MKSGKRNSVQNPTMWPGKQGTELAFTGKYHDCHEDGIYQCVCCHTDLFDSKTKFDSGTGWPSFWEPIAEENVATAVDSSHFMVRTEALCARCGAYLGHVFDVGHHPYREKVLHELCLTAFS